MTITDRRDRYAAPCGMMACYPKAHTTLASAIWNVRFEVSSAERTSSVIERQMREINRRTGVGVRWSERGANNLLKLRAARRINKDDFERLWSLV